MRRCWIFRHKPYSWRISVDIHALQCR